MIHWFLLWGSNSSRDVLCYWQQSEWIYRGATKLEPLYTALVRSYLRVSWYTESYSEVLTLVQMYFAADKQSEWIYSGSTRLEPLYTALVRLYLIVSWHTESYSEVLTLVQMYFAADKQSEWIYSGSTRLEPLYNALVRLYLIVSWHTESNLRYKLEYRCTLLLTAEWVDL